MSLDVYTSLVGFDKFRDLDLYESYENCNFSKLAVWKRSFPAYQFPLRRN